jgi:hypothetical protein
MSATATLPIPPAPSVGFSYMTAPKKPEPENVTKHTFISDEVSTPILNKITKLGLEKTEFINLCVHLAAGKAYAKLLEEQKGVERELEVLLERANVAAGVGNSGDGGASSKRKRDHHKQTHESQQ